MSEEETLAANAITTSAPEIDTADITENNVLSAATISTDAVSVPDISMSEEETFSTGALNTGSPTLGTTTINQDHVISTGALDTGNVSVPDISMSEEETLGGRDINVQDPETPSADFAQGHNFNTTELSTTPSVPSASMFEDETFSTGNLDTGAVSIGTINIVQEHDLGDASDITTGLPNVVSVDFTQGHTLQTGPLDTGEPEVDRALKTGDHNFSAPEFLMNGHILGTAFFNPALARTVAGTKERIGNRTDFKSGNSATTTNGNRIKVG